MRSFFNREHWRAEDIENCALREREKSLIDELNIMKVKRQKVKDDREKEEAALGNLLDSFKEAKDIEIQAKMETDEINRQLRTIQKHKLTALENDKKRELERLAAERERIRMKEQYLFDEVKKLSSDIVIQEENFRVQRDELQKKINKATNIGQYVQDKKVHFLKN